MKLKSSVRRCRGGALGGRLPEAVRDRAQAIIDARKAELAAAIAAGVQPAINAAKARLTDKLSQALNQKINTRISRTDDWFDPCAGVPARYHFNEKFHFIAKADIGGFGVDSDPAWEA